MIILASSLSFRSGGFRALAVALLLGLTASACGPRGCGEVSRSTATSASAAVVARSTSAAFVGPRELLVPKTTEPIKADGKFDESPWMNAGRTGAFVDGVGALGRPYSDARLLWDEQNLYLTLYAADENIEARSKEHDGPLGLDDAFSVRLGPLPAGAADGSPLANGASYQLDFAPNGAIADTRIGPDAARDATWESHVVVGVDLDGTVNDSSDEDEEWVIEAALPWSSLGVSPAPGLRIAARIGRCDTPKASKRRCTAWGDVTAAVLVLGNAGAR